MPLSNSFRTVDKDLFIQNYQHLLAQRLVQHQRRRTSNDICEAERVMIIKLQQVPGCGYIQLTFQMQGMLADLIASEKQEHEFKTAHDAEAEASAEASAEAAANAVG
jgi:hypothetical protein